MRILQRMTHLYECLLSCAVQQTVEHFRQTHTVLQVLGARERFSLRNQKANSVGEEGRQVSVVTVVFSHGVFLSFLLGLFYEV